MIKDIAILQLAHKQLLFGIKKTQVPLFKLLKFTQDW